MTDTPDAPMTTPWGVRIPGPETEAGARSPALVLPIFRNEAQARILAELYVDPDPAREFSLYAIGLWTRVAGGALHREITALVEAGLLDERLDWPLRYVRIVDNAQLPVLAELVTCTYGVKPLLERGLGEIPGIERALLHGPWALRYRGVRTHPSRDVDLLVIGTPDPEAVALLVRETEDRTRMTISSMIVTPDVWDARTDPFSVSVNECPHIPLLLR
jgi:hypothetical protein